MSIKLRWKKNKDGSKTAYLDIYDKGKRRKKYIGIRVHSRDSDKKQKKELAEAIRSKYHADWISKKYGIINEEKLDVNFIDYYREYLQSYNRRGKRKYIAAFKKFEEFLEHRQKGRVSSRTSDKNFYIKLAPISFKSVDYSLCNDFKEYLYSEKSKLNGETPYDYWKRFKAILNRAQKEKFLIDNPSDDIKVKKPKRTLKKQILSEKEIQKLGITECDQNEVKRAFLFACFTGLGEAEIRKLQWSDIRDDRLVIQRSKSKEPVIIKTNSAIQRLLGKRGMKYEKVFTLPSNTTVRKHLGRWITKAGIDKHITFYCARHTFAIMALTNGANLKTVSLLMGHSDTQATNKYLNYLDEQKDNAMDSLPEIEVKW
jgi:integrase